MNQASGVSLTSIMLIAVAIVGQVITAILLPRTDGFTSPLWTLGCIAAVTFSFFVMAYAIKTGVPLSILVPTVSVGMPLASVVIGVFLYKEPASIAKVLALCGAGVLVGVASVMN